jgi:hypothetical protein
MPESTKLPQALLEPAENLEELQLSSSTFGEMLMTGLSSVSMSGGYGLSSNGIVKFFMASGASVAFAKTLFENVAVMRNVRKKRGSADWQSSYRAATQIRGIAALKMAQSLVFPATVLGVATALEVGNRPAMVASLVAAGVSSQQCIRGGEIRNRYNDVASECYSAAHNTVVDTGMLPRIKTIGLSL